MMNGTGLVEFLKMVINIVLVSIPEEMFLVAFSLLLQKRYDLLKPSMKNAVRFFTPVLSLALLSNILRKYFAVTVDFMPIISIFILFISTVLVYRIRKAKLMIKVFASYILSYLAASIIQLSYIPLLFNATGIDAAELNNYSMLLVIITLPERVIEYCIIAYFVLKRKSIVKINIFRQIFRSKGLAIVTISIFILNILFVTVAGKLVFFNRILSGLGLAVQFIVITSVLIFPILNITMLFGVIYNITARETFNRMLSKERLSTLISILELYNQNGNYDKIDRVINDMHKHVDMLYQHK